MNPTSKKVNISPDAGEKMYWRQAEEFADLFNAYLYGGESVISAEELEEQDTDTSRILEIADTCESVKGARDVIRLAKRYHGAEYAILAIENQEGIHYAMPFRVLDYDNYTYQKQYERRRDFYKAAHYTLAGNEFLSGIRRGDRFLPVITLVLYYGEEPWDGPTCLHDMLEIDDELRPFVGDYPLHVVELRKNDLQLHNQNNIDLFKLISIIYDTQRSRQERRQAICEYESQHKLEDAVIQAVAAATGVTIQRNEEGKISMCSLWDEVREEGREAGRIEGMKAGRIEGMEAGKAEGRTLEIFDSVKVGDYSVSRGAEKLGVSEDEFVSMMTKAGYMVPAMA